VVATPAGEVPKIVENGRTGYVAGFEDVNGMAWHLVELARSPALRRQFGQSGRRRVEQDYALSELSGRLFGILGTFAAQSQRPALLRLLKTTGPTTRTDSEPSLLTAGRGGGLHLPGSRPLAKAGIQELQEWKQ
jgi:hypothetical protein